MQRWSWITQVDPCHHKGPYEGRQEGQSEILEDATLLTMKMEPRKAAPSETGKGNGSSPGASRRNQPCDAWMLAQ